MLVRAAASLFYRIDVRGMENVPEEGGVLLVSNDVSWIDGFLLLLTAPRQTRIMVQAEALRSGWLGRLARCAGAIPIAPLGSSLGDLAPPVREALLEGVLVCIFAEGEITRNGEIQSFHPEDPVNGPRYAGPAVAGLSARAVGKHLQLRRRPGLVEMAAPLALSRLGPLRAADVPAGRRSGGPSGRRRAGRAHDLKKGTGSEPPSGLDHGKTSPARCLSPFSIGS